MFVDEKGVNSRCVPSLAQREAERCRNFNPLETCGTQFEHKWADPPISWNLGREKSELPTASAQDGSASGAKVKQKTKEPC